MSDLGDGIAEGAARFVMTVIAVAFVSGVLAAVFVPKLIHHISIHWK